jgi:hypothetical protein
MAGERLKAGVRLKAGGKVRRAGAAWGRGPAARAVVQDGWVGGAWGRRPIVGAIAQCTPERGRSAAQIHIGGKPRGHQKTAVATLAAPGEAGMEAGPASASG